MIKPPPAKKKLVLDLPTDEPVKPLTKRADAEKVLLNFSVTPEFRRALKSYAAGRDEAMVDVMVRAVTREMERGN